MGTPPELYQPERGSALFQGIDGEVINTATKNLLSRGVLSKSQRDPHKQKPGRQLKISEVYVASPSLQPLAYLPLGIKTPSAVL